MSILASTRAVKAALRRRASSRGGPEKPHVLAPSGGPATVLATAAWFGLATGLVELSVLLYQHATDNSTMLGSLQMNRNFLWMIPVAQLAIFLAIGLPLAALSAFRPAFARRASAVTLGALSACSLLLMVRGLYAAAAVPLGLGIAYRVGRWVESRGFRLRKIGLLTLPVLLAIVAGLGALSYDRNVLAERRALAALPAAAPGAPNVLLLVMDTVRADHLSGYGYARATTPNLDRLAARGVVFRQARSTAPWTLPSHASLFTGRWPHELGVSGGGPLDDAYPTLAEALARRGYATAGFIANTYFCNSWFGLGRGFAHYEDYYEQNAAISASEALRCTALGRRIVKFLDDTGNGRSGDVVSLKDAVRVNRDFLDWQSRNQGRPFFAFLNYMDAHDPYLPPPEFDRHFGVKPETPEDFHTIRSWHEKDKKAASPRDIVLVKDAYDDCLAYLDREIGRLFDDLERRGLLENTVVVITSDHGEGLGEHDLYGHGLSLYRHEVHVPLLILGPKGVPAGRVVGEAVSLKDVAATVAERVGLADQSPFTGRSLARFWEPTIAGGGTAAEEPILSEVAVRGKISQNPKRAPARRGPMASLVAEGKVYIRDAVGREELFDLDNDPGELDNQANSPEIRPVLERSRGTLTRSVPVEKNR